MQLCIRLNRMVEYLVDRNHKFIRHHGVEEQREVQFQHHRLKCVYL